LKWKTIETLHFSIHYYDGLEPMARKLAPIAENTYSRLTPLLKHTPYLKTDVVLLDTYDFTNGSTSVIPNPLITLYAADIGGNLKPSYYDDWLAFVFLHEYTHLLNLDYTPPGFYLLRTLFGRVVFPNAIAPTFLIEGLATYMETKYSRGGRGYDPRWLAMIRMDVLENNMKSLDQASVDTVRWPGGHLRYLYGVMFYEYLADKYGEEKLLEFTRTYGDYILSSGVDAPFHELFGKTLIGLWNDWQEDMKIKYADQKAKLSAAGLTEFRTLTENGYYNLNPCWSADSRYLFYNQSNADTSSQIRKFDVMTGKDVRIIDGIVQDDALSFSGDELYFTQGDIDRNFYLLKDIYRLNVLTGKTQRLTQSSRAADPAISPDGRWIAFNTDKRGVRSLWISDPALKNPRQIGVNTENSQYLSPRLSPDGKQIAVAKFTSGHTKIYLVDPTTGMETPMVEGDLGVEGNPSFSPDGKYVLFDSDRSQIVNLYAYDLKSGQLYQVTNVLGAAMMPAVSPDSQKIAFVTYSSRGHDLAVMDYAPTKWKPVFGVRPFNYQPPPPISPEAVILEKHDYNPLPALLPKFWLPYTYYDENAEHTLAVTGGLDSLGHHLYDIQAGYDWKSKRPSFNVAYINNQLLPQIAVLASDVAVPYAWDSATTTYWERQRAAGLFFSFFGNRVFRYYDRQSLTLGCHWTHLSSITPLSSLVLQPDSGDLKGATVAYRYSSLRSYGYSIAPEEGLSLSGRVDMYSKELGSKFDLTTYLVKGSTYLGMPIKHNVLGLSLNGFYGRGDRIVQTDLTRTSVMVRGYQTAPTGNKIVTGTLAYHFPIAYMETGLSYGYMFFDRLSANFFFDQGGVTSGALSSFDWRRGVGGELTLATVNGFGYLPLNFILGYAKGLDAGGEDQIYVNISL
jgi:Tol biopolymer transport system component